MKKHLRNKTSIGHPIRQIESNKRTNAKRQERENGETTDPTVHPQYNNTQRHDDDDTCICVLKNFGFGIIRQVGIESVV